MVAQQRTIASLWPPYADQPPALSNSYTDRAMFARNPGRSRVMTTSIKQVLATIKPHRLRDVVEALRHVGVHEFIATEIRDYGQQGATEFYRGAEYTPDFVPMLRLEAVVADSQLDQTVAAIRGAVGPTDDGWIYVVGLGVNAFFDIGASGDHHPRRAA